jgi:hypothetical protein
MSPRRASIGRILVVALSAALSGPLVGCHRAKPASSGATPALVTSAGDSAAVPSTPAPAPLVRIPRDAARFEIEVVDDSTARFKPREASWVKPGMVALVVDPLNRDALVARTRIVSVWNETAVAVVTSQVTRVTTQHVVLLTPPTVAWWRTSGFWRGLVLGTLLGGSTGAIIASH